MCENYIKKIKTYSPVSLFSIAATVQESSLVLAMKLRKDSQSLSAQISSVFSRESLCIWSDSHWTDRRYTHELEWLYCGRRCGAPIYTALWRHGIIDVTRAQVEPRCPRALSFTSDSPQQSLYYEFVALKCLFSKDYNQRARDRASFADLLTGEHPPTESWVIWTIICAVCLVFLCILWVLFVSSE